MFLYPKQRATPRRPGTLWRGSLLGVALVLAADLALVAACWLLIR